jgi:hypothetical protein
LKDGAGERMNLEAVSLWSLGALFGLRHALEPDHLAALAALITQRPGVRPAVGAGVAWGLGHTLALLAVASALALLRARLSPVVVTAFEVGVGLMLILLGVQALQRTFTSRPPPPQHRHESADWATARRSLLVGIAHGLAGSGAVTALIAAQFPSVAGRIGYVAVFGVGSMIGMATLSGLAGVPLARAIRRPALAKALGAAGGALAIVVGVVWLIRELRALSG